MLMLYYERWYLMNCNACGKNEVIYSGIDAWVMGVPTESVCYSCAAIYNKVVELNEKNKQKVEAVK